MGCVTVVGFYVRLDYGSSCWACTWSVVNLVYLHLFELQAVVVFEEQVCFESTSSCAKVTSTQSPNFHHQPALVSAFLTGNIAIIQEGVSSHIVHRSSWVTVSWQTVFSGNTIKLLQFDLYPRPSRLGILLPWLLAEFGFNPRLLLLTLNECTRLVYLFSQKTRQALPSQNEIS